MAGSVGPILWPLLLTAMVACGITAMVVRWGKRWGIMDDPLVHKHPKVVHEKAVPRGGGVAIFGALVVGAMVFLPKDIKTWGILGGAMILAITGFLDDKYSEQVSPYVRLGLNVLAALAVIGVGIGIAYVTNPLGGIIRLDGWQYCFEALGGRHCLWIWSDIFAVIWLVWMQNVVGWSSGVDGQMPGFVAIAAVTMGILAMRFNDPSQWPVITLAGITAGAYLGFLPWNWYPQKIMPGYGGKSLAGFLLGTLAILSAAKVGALLMVLGIPIVDGLLVILKRIKEGRSPVWGGRDHLHHFLLDRRWGKRRIALFYWIVSATLAFLAIRLNSTSKYFTMALVGAGIGGVILWLHYFSTYSKQPDRGSG